MRKNLLIIFIILTLLTIALVVLLFVNKDNIIEPRMSFPELEPFQSILSRVVFVTKGIYGGNLEYNCILKGKIRNVTNKPYKDIYIIWTFWDKNNKLFPVYARSYEMPSMFSDKIDYLDSKAEADFQISLDLYSDLSMDSAHAIREAVINDRYEAGVYVLNKKKVKKMQYSIKKQQEAEQIRIKELKKEVEEKFSFEKLSGRTSKEIAEILGGPIAVIREKGATQRQYNIKGKIITIFFDENDIYSSWSQ